jgi:integrase
LNHDDSGALFRPLHNSRSKSVLRAITPDGLYKIVRKYSAALGFEIGAHALRATAATNALDHQADIAKVQEWLGHANIATTRIYDHRKTGPKTHPLSRWRIKRQAFTGPVRRDYVPVDKR